MPNTKGSVYTEVAVCTHTHDDLNIENEGPYLLVTAKISTQQQLDGF